MMRIKNKKILICVLTILSSILLIVNAYAGGPGTTTARFLKIGIGARNIAMGETGATSEDVNSIYWNPAGLTSVNEKEVSMMHTVWLETINYEHLALGFPTRYGNLGGAVNYLFMEDMDKYDNIGNKQLEKSSANDMVLTLTYSRNIAMGVYNIPSINIGINIKYLQSKLETLQANAFATDIGFQMNSKKKELKFGLILQNIGTGMKFISENAQLPQNIKSGIAYILPIGKQCNPLELALDINFPNDNDFRINFGAEYVMEFSSGIKLSPRLGYRSATKGLEGFAGVTVGGGFKFKDYSVDYAFAPYGQLGNTHRMSLSMKFGNKGEGDKEEQKLVKQKVEQKQLKKQESVKKEPEEPLTVKESTPVIKPTIEESVVKSTEEINKELGKKEVSVLSLKLIVNSDKLFDVDGSTLTPEGCKRLDEIVQLLQASPKDKVLIETYTDNVRSREMNIELSNKQAQSIYDYLVQKGIDASRIKAKGYGPDKPVASNDTVEGRAKNRRVEMIVLKENCEISFSIGKYDIRNESNKSLNEIVELIKAYREGKVLIEGHTDITGSREINMELSINRAKSVCDYFIKQGIEPTRIEIKGYGPDKPVASNDTVEGRAKNRRVEIILYK